ncbi:MAG: 5-formyltetrahydrofolate cyclo-ligase [Bacteroidales bacterium]|nr:5-formyltetrahydrofolate cyclo-ligase [Bacteroidales bacterium]MBR5777882.1 5-formyltetrahydrofolate cyclo-ligase [Bacteroidales bacterium]
MTKDELRKLVRAEKKKVSLEEKKQRSEKIWQQLETDPKFVSASVVLLYWSMADEVYTHDFVQKWAQKKTLLLPVVDGDTLRIKPFTTIDNMVISEQFGIGEPIGDDYTNLSDIDVIIVPGVAFDRKKNRMGRGRGYYDRLLSTCDAHKIGVGFDFQLFDTVPTQPFDIPMDSVVTETEVFL